MWPFVAFVTRANPLPPAALLPYYYVPQIYFEMRCTNTRSCLFTSWGETGTNVWYVPFDVDMWLKTYELMSDFVIADLPFELFRRRCERYTLEARRYSANCESLHPKGGFASIRDAQIQ